MGVRVVTLGDVVQRHIPSDLTGVRWADGTVECRFNLASTDYAARTRSEGRTDRGVGEVLVGDDVVCDRCAEKCG